MEIPSIRELSRDYGVSREKVNKVIKEVIPNKEYKEVYYNELEIIKGKLSEIKWEKEHKEEKIKKVLSTPHKNRAIPETTQKKYSTIKERLNIAREEYNFLLDQVDKDKELLNGLTLNPNDLQTYKAIYRKDLEALNKQEEHLNKLEEDYNQNILNNPFND